MTTPSRTLTLWDADVMIDEAQTKIAEHSGRSGECDRLADWADRACPLVE